MSGGGSKPRGREGSLTETHTQGIPCPTSNCSSSNSSSSNSSSSNKGRRSEDALISCWSGNTSTLTDISKTMCSDKLMQATAAAGERGPRRAPAAAAAAAAAGAAGRSRRCRRTRESAWNSLLRECSDPKACWTASHHVDRQRGSCTLIQKKGGDIWTIPTLHASSLPLQD
ncbi:hypothetical protein Emag_005342 [Eimeria magna]